MSQITIFRIAAVLLATVVLQRCVIKDHSTIYPAEVGFLVDDKTGRPTDRHILEPGEVEFPGNQQLLTFSLVTDTLILDGFAQTVDSLNVLFHCAIKYQIQKSNVITLYEKYTINFQSVMAEPESKAIVRDVLSTYAMSVPSNVLIKEIEKKLRLALNERFLTLVGVDNLVVTLQKADSN